MKGGDLVVFSGSELAPQPDKKDFRQIGVVLLERSPRNNPHWEPNGIRNYCIYFPHFDEHVNGWSDEYKVISEGR